VIASSSTSRAAFEMGSPAICLAEFDNRTQAEDNDSLDMERVPVGCMATTNAALARLQSHSQTFLPKRTKTHEDQISE